MKPKGKMSKPRKKLWDGLAEFILLVAVLCIGIVIGINLGAGHERGKCDRLSAHEAERSGDE